jgi:hypothetical protein
VGNDPLNQVDPSGLCAAQVFQSPKVPAAGFAGLGQQGGITVSGGGTSEVKASMATPMISLAAAGNASAPMTRPGAYSSLVTSGRTSPYYSRAEPRPEPLDEQAREAAFFADKVYQPAYDNNGALRGGLLKAFGVDYQPPGGFQAALFEGSNRTAILAVRGTELRKGWETYLDVRADVRQPLGLEVEEYAYGIKLIQQTQRAVEKAGLKLLVTGHSMGAAIGAAGAYATGCDAELFNPAWLHPRYSQGTPGKMKSHITIGDPVEEARKFFGGRISGEAIYHERQPGTDSAHSMSNFLK